MVVVLVQLRLACPVVYLLYLQLEVVYQLPLHRLIRLGVAMKTAVAALRALLFRVLLLPLVAVQHLRQLDKVGRYVGDAAQPLGAALVVALLSLFLWFKRGLPLVDDAEP